MLRSKTCITVSLLLMQMTLLLAGFPGVNYKAKEVVTKKPAAQPGGVAVVVNAIEFEVTGEEPFPVRALDPVLHVGNVEVREYRYADISNKTLIFTVYEGEPLTDNAPVYLQYEKDKSTRTDLPRFHFAMIEARK